MNGGWEQSQRPLLNSSRGLGIEASKPIMGNDQGKEHDHNGAPTSTNPPGTGEKVKKSHKKPKKDTPATVPTKSTVLKDIDTSRLKHDITDPIENYYTVTEKVLGRYVCGISLHEKETKK